MLLKYCEMWSILQLVLKAGVDCSIYIILFKLFQMILNIFFIQFALWLFHEVLAWSFSFDKRKVVECL